MKIKLNNDKIKIKLNILKEENPNPTDEEYYGYFEEIKSKMEKSLTKYANKGILPNEDEQLIAIHPNGFWLDYIVISRRFWEDSIWIWVQWT